MRQAIGTAVQLPSTLIFDYPTAREIAALLSTATPIAPLHRAQPAPSAVSTHDGMVVALRGLGALFPASIASLPSAWHMAACGHNTIGEVPASRWDSASVAPRSDDVDARVRHGGFLVGAERFDRTFFGVSPAEAAAMDPQQRLLLERGYEALHAAGHDRASLLGSNMGVFVGIAANDFAEVLKASPQGQSVYAATGAAHAIASGRLSYIFGLQGPCAAYDTACSSTLTACHAALRAAQLRE